MKSVRFGVIGCGRIATQFVNEVKNLKGVEVLGVVARDYNKVLKYAKNHHIERAYKKVEDLLKDEDIDAVYIATFHPTHFNYTMMALEASKNVLCEKPATLKLDELEKVISLSKKKNLLFMEAMTVGFHPLYKKMKMLINKGVIGEIYHVESTYGRISTKKHKHNPSQAGGALYDIGIYNIFLSVDLLGDLKVCGTSSRKNSWGVEGGISALLSDNGRSATFYATMDSISGECAKIVGSKGVILLDHPWTTPTSFTIIGENGSKKTYKSEDEVEWSKEKWLSYEVEAFSNGVRDGLVEVEAMNYEKTKNVHKILDEIATRENLLSDDLEKSIY